MYALSDTLRLLSTSSRFHWSAELEPEPGTDCRTRPAGVGVEAGDVADVGVALGVAARKTRFLRGSGVGDVSREAVRPRSAILMGVVSKPLVLTGVLIRVE